MSRRKKKKKGRRKSGSGGGSFGRRFRPILGSVEFASGHDGFLRGKPEPVIILAAFAISERQTSLIGRALRRVPVHEPYPSVTEITLIKERELFDVPVPEEYKRVLLMGLAIEEDGGRDVSELYGSLEVPETIASWSLGDAMPQPVTLGEAGVGDLSIPPKALAVHLIRDGVYLSETCSSDDWIGAAVVVLDVEQSRRQQWRFPFVSKDGRNDWTCVLETRFSG